MTNRVERISTHDKHLDIYKNGDSFDGLTQIIYNSLDANASEVEIFISENELSGIETIKVVDNGTGIPAPDKKNPKDPFLNLGYSNKRISDQNAFGRNIHGKAGEGRFKAYTLGHNLEWKTKTAKASTIISANIDSPQDFTIIDNARLPEITAQTGTIFTATNCEQVKLPSMEVLKERLEKYFLTVVDDTRVKIKLNNNILVSKTHIAHQDEAALPKPNADVKAKTVVWRTTAAENNKLFWCDHDYNTLLETPLDSGKLKTNHSLYIASKKVEIAKNENRLHMTAMDSTFQTIEAHAKDSMEKFLIASSMAEAGNIIKQLKDEKIYPFNTTTTASEVTQKTQVVYDAIVVKLNQTKPAIFKSKYRKFIVDTLKLIVEKEPEHFARILKELLGLTPEETEDFAKLLDRTTLSSMIKTSQTIIRRLDFIQALKNMVHGDLAKIVKERSQLHKVIEKEAWIFGEQYNLMTSDKSFNTTIEGIRTNIKDFCGDYEVEGGERISDLFFTQKTFIGAEPHALIVELKRPKVPIGKKETQQIKDYYDIVKDRPEFANWRISLVLVSTDIEDNILQGEISDPQTGEMNYSKNPMRKLYIKRWGDLIDGNEARLNELRKSLDMNLGQDDGSKYLKSNYGHLGLDTPKAKIKDGAKAK